MTAGVRWHIRPQWGFGVDAFCGKPSSIRWTGAWDLPTIFTEQGIPEDGKHFCRNCARVYNRKLEREARHG